MFSLEEPLRNIYCRRAQKFGSDLADLIEQNRGNSSAGLMIVRLSTGQRWQRDEMHEWNSYPV